MCIVNAGYALGCLHAQRYQLYLSCAAGFDHGLRTCRDSNHQIRNSKPLFAHYFCNACHEKRIWFIELTHEHLHSEACEQGVEERQPESWFEIASLMAKRGKEKDRALFEEGCERKAQANADEINGGSRDDGIFVDLEPPSAYEDGDSSDDEVEDEEFGVGEYEDAELADDVSEGDEEGPIRGGFACDLDELVSSARRAADNDNDDDMSEDDDDSFWSELETEHQEAEGR